MSREEAIEILKNAAWLGTDKDREQTETAVEMAISALEQEPVMQTGKPGSEYVFNPAEPCGDAISREMALDGIDAMYNNSWDIKDFRENVNLMLNKLPSVQPSRKGQWIKERPWLKVHCSECGKDAIGNHGFDALKTYFCPYCGADMRGDTDDNAG